MADPKLTKVERALFLAAPLCLRNDSEAGAAIAEVLGLPFPLTMVDLASSLRSRGKNPATIYPSLKYFTAAELDAYTPAAALTNGGGDA